MINKIRDKFIKRVDSEITAMIEPWPLIQITKPVPDCQPTMNRQCMYNAVNELKAGRAVAVLEVVRIRRPIAHYLCMDSQGLIYDPTLGWSYSNDDYRLNRYIHPDDVCLSDMGERLNEFKSEIVEMTSKKTKLFAKVLRLDNDELV